MAPRELVLSGTPSSDRLFANKRRLDQTYYRYLRGFEGNDLLYGNIGIAKLEGGAGVDTFIFSNRAGGTATTDYVAVLDYRPGEGDTVALAGVLQPGDVEILDVAGSDLAILNNSYDPYRVAASIGDSFIRSKTTGEILGVIKSTSSGSVQLSGNITSSLTASEQQIIAPQNGGRIPVQNFNASSPADGVRIVEFADLSNKDFPAYYLSSAAYSTFAGGTDTYNKFVSFDFTDPPSPYGTYINGRVGPLQHTHTNELETFFVVSGTYIFTDGGQTGVTTGELKDVEVPPGTLVVGPQGFVHGFRSKSDDGPARIFSWALPAGLEKFFQDSGTKVSNRYTQIVPNSALEAQNTAFWAGQRGDALFLTPWDLEQMGPGGSWANLRPPYTGSSIDGRPIPTKSAIWPQMMSPSIFSSERPTVNSAFGEKRLSLVNQSEAGDITGKVAWKGAVGPKQPGGTFSYDSLSFKSGTNSDFSRSTVVSGSTVPNTLQVATPSGFDIIYTLTDGLSLRLFDQTDPTNPSAGNNPTYDLDALTFVQLPAGTKYSLANSGGEEAVALSIHTFNSPIAPKPTITPKKNLLTLQGDPVLAPLKFKIDSIGGGVGEFTQVAVVPTDSNGRLLPQSMSHHASKADKPGSPVFKLEALRQAKLITTVINDSTIQLKGSTSTLSNFGSENLLFLTVKDQTLAEVLQDAERGDRKSLDAVKFGNSAVSLKKSSSETVKVIGKDSGSFQMSVKPGSTGAQIYG